MSGVGCAMFHLMLIPVSFCSVALRSEAGAEPPLPGFTVPATKPVGTVFIMSRQDKSGVFEKSRSKLFIKGIGMSLFFSKRSFSLFLLVCVGIFIKIDQTTFCFQYSFSELSYINLLASKIGFYFVSCISLPKTVHGVFPNMTLL